MREHKAQYLHQLVAETEAALVPVYASLDRTILANQKRVLDAFRRNRISDFHFRGSTGYGYGDDGRDKLDRVYAAVFGAEEALVRTQFVSGTHALATCLRGILRPGEGMVALGRPYDTLRTVIGLTGNARRSLLKMGIAYREAPLAEDGTIDPDALDRAVDERTRLVFLQRSRGYDPRPSFSIKALERVIEHLHRRHPGVIAMVDNCYGEFAEEREPTHVGADIIGGSLTKNPGGGLVPTGGYVAGRRDLVDLAAEQLTAPGLGRDIGAVPGGTGAYYQGLFLAPHFVGQALKGMAFAAGLLERLGFVTSPRYDEHRTDIVQAVQMGDAEKVLAFCRAIQATAPIDAHVTPEPAPLPGYEDGVVMAAGTFIQGATLEFTADAPMREPYMVYMQGGLTREHVKLGIVEACAALLDIM